jgi:hypothetical protein
MEISITIVQYGAGVEDSIHVLNPVVNPFPEGRYNISSIEKFEINSRSV